LEKINAMKQLTAKNGEKEWLLGSTTIIAMPAKSGCVGCNLRFMDECALTENINKIPDCLIGFSKSIIYIEKPAEK